MGSVFRGQAKWQIATLIVFRFGSVVVASSGETNGLLVLLEDFEVPSKKSAANFEQLRAVLIMKIRKKNRKYSSNVFKEWLSICDDVVIFWWISRKGYSRIDSFDLMLRGFTQAKQNHVIHIVAVFSSM